MSLGEGFGVGFPEGEVSRDGGGRGLEGVCGEFWCGGGGYMREMGAICQIGVFTWKSCTFRVQNGFIFGLFALRFQ